MHSYQSLRLDEGSIPQIETFHFHDALDVIEYAAYDGLFDWRTWPEIWHIDDDGVVQCYSRGFRHSSIRQWADNPSELYKMRRVGLAETGCAPRWLINEPRFTDMARGPVDEVDARAFVTLRGALAHVGVQLVDCMLWSEDLRCWSMHELTSGTTRWESPT